MIFTKNSPTRAIEDCVPLSTDCDPQSDASDLRRSIEVLAAQQAMLAEQQKRLIEKLETSDSALRPKKDVWDRTMAVAPIISALIIASGGAWFTAIYNQQQLKLQEIQTIEKFFPHLRTGDEKSKRAAILAISSLADAKLASNVAAIFASEGTVSALEQIAKHGENGDRKIASGALERALDSMAANYQTEKRYDDAIKTAERALALRAQTYGPSDQRILPSLNQLTDLYLRNRSFAEAESLLQRAIAIQKSVYGADSSQVADELRRLAELYSAQGFGEKSRAIAARAAAIEEKTSPKAQAVPDPQTDQSSDDSSIVLPVSHPEEQLIEQSPVRVFSEKKSGEPASSRDKKSAGLSQVVEAKEVERVIPSSSDASTPESPHAVSDPVQVEPLRSEHLRASKTSRVQ
jgi:hypothetical protein